MAERTPWSLSGALRGVFAKKTIDADTWDDLEDSLIQADFGPDITDAIVAELRAKVSRYNTTDPKDLHRMLREGIEERLAKLDSTLNLSARPAVVLVVGVNGVGKTTSIAKLARFYQMRGERVLIAAGDTFRAAAIDQIALWGERLGIDVIRQKPGGDPAAVVFDALQAGRARKAQHIIIDTAGRLHTKDHLMAELAKIGRIIQREAADWTVEALLVLDATTGSNAIQQAREFIKVAPVDGVILTKLDGTAKGGMAVAVATELKLPIRFIGVGEKAEDLLEFRARDFANALFE